MGNYSIESLIKRGAVIPDPQGIIVDESAEITVIERTGALSGVEQELSAFGFLRCNKCYLVNPKFIVKVKGCTVQVGDNVLQISRPRRAAFMAELANWYAGSMGGQ